MRNLAGQAPSFLIHPDVIDQIALGKDGVVDTLGSVPGAADREVEDYVLSRRPHIAGSERAMDGLTVPG